MPTNTPITEMPEITLITLVDFFENRYLRAMKKEKFTLYLCGFEQAINILIIIERIVDKKIELRYGSYLVADPVPEFKPDFIPVLFYLTQKLLFFSFSEKAKVNFCKKKIGRNINLGYSDHIAGELITAHSLEYFSHILLYQSCNFMLACCFHAAKVLIL